MVAIAAVKSERSAKREPKTWTAAEHAQQAQRTALRRPAQDDEETGSTQAARAKFVTGRNPVIETANGGRLPAVLLREATQLNSSRDALEHHDLLQSIRTNGIMREAWDGTIHGARELDGPEPEAHSRKSTPHSRTNPPFLPLPLSGPPTPLRSLQYLIFFVSSAILSSCILFLITSAAIASATPTLLRRIWCRLRFRDPDVERPFHQEELRRKRTREAADRSWEKRKQQKIGYKRHDDSYQDDGFVPTEGGSDPMVSNIGYYARRVGLDCEIFFVHTEDGFILELWHLYNPQEYTAADPSRRQYHSADDLLPRLPGQISGSQYLEGRKKYPVLLLHGLLQSAGAYCCTDDSSLAFYLAKSGYDVWLGNNRCSPKPQHKLFTYLDPRMWTWNTRHLGVLDMPALVSRVLSETGFEKLGLVGHSQGTTQALVALAKDQRPEIGEKISVFYALSPAAYAGRLIKEGIFFKLLRALSPNMFKAIFGIHAFVPSMKLMHDLLPSRIFGLVAYVISNFLLEWSDERWERDLRARCFRFTPVYVSVEVVRWWVGRGCFAAQGCIFATREEGQMGDGKDGEEEYYSDNVAPQIEKRATRHRGSCNRGRHAWYNEKFPPIALWIAGADQLVDGRRFLRQFERGREPYVEVVHSKIIDEYKHLDMLWAIDSLEKVGKEVLEVIWKTAPKEAKTVCRIPIGCENVEDWEGRRER